MVISVCELIRDRRIDNSVCVRGIYTVEFVILNRTDCKSEAFFIASDLIVSQEYPGFRNLRSNARTLRAARKFGNINCDVYETGR